MRGIVGSQHSIQSGLVCVARAVNSADVLTELPPTIVKKNKRSKRRLRKRRRKGRKSLTVNRPSTNQKAGLSALESLWRTSSEPWSAMSGFNLVYSRAPLPQAESAYSGIDSDTMSVSSVATADFASNVTVPASPSPSPPSLVASTVGRPAGHDERSLSPQRGQSSHPPLPPKPTLSGKAPVSLKPTLSATPEGSGSARPPVAPKPTLSAKTIPPESPPKRSVKTALRVHETVPLGDDDSPEAFGSVKASSLDKVDARTPPQDKESWQERAPKRDSSSNTQSGAPPQEEALQVKKQTNTLTNLAADVHRWVGDEPKAAWAASTVNVSLERISGNSWAGSVEAADKGVLVSLSESGNLAGKDDGASVFTNNRGPSAGFLIEDDGSNRCQQIMQGWHDRIETCAQAGRSLCPETILRLWLDAVLTECSYRDGLPASAHRLIDKMVKQHFNFSPLTVARLAVDCCDAAEDETPNWNPSTLDHKWPPNLVKELITVFLKQPLNLHFYKDFTDYMRGVEDSWDTNSCYTGGSLSSLASTQSGVHDWFDDFARLLEEVGKQFSAQLKPLFYYLGKRLEWGDSLVRLMQNKINNDLHVIVNDARGKLQSLDHLIDALVISPHLQ